MTLSRSPQCRAVMDEKSLSPLFPVGGGVGGAVVTNDLCIMLQYFNPITANKNL